MLATEIPNISTCKNCHSKVIIIMYTGILCSASELGDILAKIVKTTGCDLAKKGQVLLARDTRYGLTINVQYRPLVESFQERHEFCGLIATHESVSMPHPPIRLKSSPVIQSCIVILSRPSGERLAEHLIKAVQLAGCDCTDYGETCAIALYIIIFIYVFVFLKASLVLPNYIIL